MKTLITKLARNEPFDNVDIEQALFDICDDEHGSCNDRCPVYEMNNSYAVNNHKSFKENRGCDCFKNGQRMLAFLRGEFVDERDFLKEKL